MRIDCHFCANSHTHTSSAPFSISSIFFNKLHKIDTSICNLYHFSFICFFSFVPCLLSCEATPFFLVLYINLRLSATFDAVAIKASRKALSGILYINPPSSAFCLGRTFLLLSRRKNMKCLLMRMCAAAYGFLILSQFFFANAMLDPIDFLALQSIRKRLSDMPGSNYFASWDFTSDPCNFAGVYCDGDRVVALNLGDPRAGSPGLSGRLDPAIGKLSALAELTIVPGRIMGSLPHTLSQLKYLRFLAISRNFISGEIPSSLGQLRGLRTLDLSFNQLKGSIPSAVGNLPELSNVILCHNRLSGSVPPFVSQSLTRLDLKHNDLSGSLPPHGLPSSLEYLSLSWNRLTGPVDRPLSRLNRLNYIDLSLNRFTGCIPSILFTFPISSLQLQRNEFSGPVQPENLVSIPAVDLSFNQLTGGVSPTFATVQKLYLNNNRFTGQVPGTLVDRVLSASIQLLYLQHNYLTGIEINPTVEIPLSTSLCLQYNCMVLPVETPCPLRAGKQKTRPTAQCTEWKG